MKKTGAVLAFDTSNYTTSIALMDLDGNLLDHQRQLLSVEDGKRGLRQSEALFQHVQRLPQLMELLAPALEHVFLKALGFSGQPRRVEGSYMPVFLAGEALARSLSTSHALPCFSFSHQEGHIAAGLWSLGLTAEKPFYTLHLSGGTTELLKVTPASYPGDAADRKDVKQGVSYQEKVVGETSDISLGQLIDRVGVAMGLSFPAGPALEQLALNCKEDPFETPFSIKQVFPVFTESAGGLVQTSKPIFSLSLSGPKTYLLRKLTSASKEQVALSVFCFTGKVLSRLLIKAQQVEPLPMLLSVGGVASNTIVRQVMAQKLGKAREGANLTLHFAQPSHCSDSAIGTVSLTLQSLNHLNLTRLEPLP